MATTAHQVLNI